MSVARGTEWQARGRRPELRVLGLTVRGLLVALSARRSARRPLAARISRLARIATSAARELLLSRGPIGAPNGFVPPAE